MDNCKSTSYKEKQDKLLRRIRSLFSLIVIHRVFLLTRRSAVGVPISILWFWWVQGRSLNICTNLAHSTTKLWSDISFSKVDEGKQKQKHTQTQTQTQTPLCIEKGTLRSIVDDVALLRHCENKGCWSGSFNLTKHGILDII